MFQLHYSVFYTKYKILSLYQPAVIFKQIPTHKDMLLLHWPGCAPTCMEYYTKEIVILSCLSVAPSVPISSPSLR